MLNERYRAEFRPGEIYHLIAKANEDELLFQDDPDKDRLLDKLFEVAGPFMDIECYKLLDTHLHLKVTICTMDEIERRLIGSNITPPRRDYEFSAMIVEQLRRIWISHSMFYNYKYDRKGNLFHRTFRRIHVDSIDYEFQLDAYILCNSDVHGLEDFEESDYSSYWQSVNNQVLQDMAEEKNLQKMKTRLKLLRRYKELARGRAQGVTWPVTLRISRYGSLEIFLYLLRSYAKAVRAGESYKVYEELQKLLK